MEKWKDISNYEGIYQVSTIGRVRRVCGSKTSPNGHRVLKNKTKSNGYKFVSLSKENVVKYKHVHRLVAEAFIDNPFNKPHVNHLDCNKSNNRTSNLEWVTPLENNAHARENVVFSTEGYLRGIDHPMSYPVSQSDNGKIVMVWGSITEASAHYNISSSTIGKGIREKKVAVGFYWEEISVKTYIELKNSFSNPPEITANIHSRDNTNALEAQRKKRAAITNEILIDHGIRCFKENKSLIRRHWDKYAKANKVFTYIPISKRFGGFGKFKEEVLSRIT